MIKSNIDINVKGYKAILDKKIQVYQGDTFYLTFQLSDTIIDEIDSVKVKDGILPLTEDIEAYMLVGNDKVDGTLIEDNRVVFKLKQQYTKEVGIHYLQIVITEMDEDGEKEIVHTPEFTYEVKEAIGLLDIPEEPDVPPPKPPQDDYSRVDEALVDKGIVARASLFDLDADVKNMEITIDYLQDKLEGGRWYSGEVITELKLNQMWGVSDNHEGRLRTIESALDELMYKPIVISSLSLSKTVAEMGEIVTGLRATWTYNKSPTTQSFDGITLDNAVRSYDIIGDITSNKSYRLSASDGKTNVSRNVGINFYNGKYYGATLEPTGYDSNFVMTLNKQLTNNKNGDFSVNCMTNQYIFFAIPTRFGKPTFKVGGFEGGFVLVNTIKFTNKFGYTEDYNIYKSENASLGNTTVSIS